MGSTIAAPDMSTVSRCLLLAAVILMEGGTDLDLSILDEPPEKEEGMRSRTTSENIAVDKSSV